MRPAARGRSAPTALGDGVTEDQVERWVPAASFGPSGATAHRRFTELTKARVWAKLHRLVLDELGSRGDLDWSRRAIESVNMRALKRGT